MFPCRGGEVPEDGDVDDGGGAAGRVAAVLGHHPYPVEVGGFPLHRRARLDGTSLLVNLEEGGGRVVADDAIGQGLEVLLWVEENDIITTDKLQPIDNKKRLGLDCS